MRACSTSRLSRLLLPIFLISIVGPGCKKPAAISITGSSPGITNLEENAKPDPVHVYFDGSAAKLEEVGKVVSAGLSIAPEIAGEWRWTTDRHLTFTPAQDWAVGEKYSVRFEKSFFPEHVRMARYSYEFTTPAFGASISNAEFYLHPKNPNIKKIVATATFTHPVATDEFEKSIRVQEKGLVFVRKELPYTVSYNKHKTEAYLHVMLAEIPKKDTEAFIRLEKGFGSSRGGRPLSDPVESRVVVPGVFSVFRVRDAALSLVRNDRYEPEQVLIAEFTNGTTELEVQKHLEAYLLPVDLPAIQGRKGHRQYHWNDPKIIGPEVLQLSEKIQLTPLPTSEEYARLHSFKYTADVGRYVYVRMAEGMTSYGDFILAKTFDRVLRVPAFPKELNIMHDGAILSVSGDRKLSILSRGIDAVRFQVERVLPGQINHLVTQAGGQFRSPNFQNYRFNEQNISERFHEERMLELMPPGKTQYSSFDFSSYLTNASGDRRLGLFFFQVEAWDPVRKRSLGQADNRLILVTDLGVIAKDAKDGSHEVFVQSIRTGEPQAGAVVEVLGKNGVAVASYTTGPSGRVSIPSLHGLDDHKTPTVYLVRNGEDVSFLPYNWHDRQLNLSRFDVGGAYIPVSQNGLTAFLFSERGLYRPGENFHIGMIVKPMDWKSSANLAGVPLEAVIQDPRGVEIHKSRFRLSDLGFEELSYATEEVSPTGNYQVTLYTVRDNRRWNDLGSISLRVEEFEPDRMRIATRFSAGDGAGWVSPDELKAHVSLKTMFGTPAADRRVSAQIRLAPTYPSFRGYSEYTFFDPLRAKREFSERLPDVTSDSDGEAVYDLKLERFEKATYRVSFEAHGFEAGGGRSVTSESSVLVSPLDYLIGYKEDGNLRYISKGSERSVNVIAIGRDLKKKAVSGLQRALLRQQYVSVLTRQENNTFKYESVLRETPVSQTPVTVPEAGLEQPLATDNPGDYVVVFKDAELNELIRIPYSVVGAANLTMNLERNAEIQIKLDREDYNPGDEIELQIIAPYAGAGLITIERDKVYAHKWFQSSKTSSVQRIRVPEGLEGNAYVNVAFVRDIASPEIFMSPLSYSVAPFSISRASRTNKIDIDSPDVARPGEPFKIRYKTEQPARIVIYAVDEGILQVAGYRLPDPLSYFFRKQALEVTTQQILDLILPEFKLVKALSAPGGDEDAVEALGRNLNPFRRKRDKSVVFWSGLIDSDSTPRELTYEVPDYFDGTLRVMAVAVSRNAIGTFEKKSTIRGHFVLTPTVPAFSTPGDELNVPVAVANNVEGSGKNAPVRVALEVSEHFEIVGEKEKAVEISEGREKNVVFRVKTRKQPGSATIRFVASRDKLRSTRRVGISVRPATPYITTLKGGYIKDDKETVETPRRMYPPYRVLEAAVSPLPLVLAKGLRVYLEHYPYQQTVAVVSQAVSAMALADIPELASPAATVAQALERAYGLLTARQNPQGAFGFWAANSHADPYETVFAFHFLTEAKLRGQAVPASVHARGITYLRNHAGSLGRTLNDARLRAYAVYVLTRNGIITTNYLQTLRTQMEKNHKGLWEDDLAGIYLAAAYKLMKLDGEANALIRKSRLGQRLGEPVPVSRSQFLRDSQLLLILSLHFPDRLSSLQGSDLVSLVSPITGGCYDPMSAASAIWAMSAYAKKLGPVDPARVTIAEIVGGDAKPVKYTGSVFPTGKFSPEATAVVVGSEMKTPIFYNVTQAGFDLEPAAEALKNRIEVQREYQEGGNVVTSTKLGSEIEVHVKLRTIDEAGSHSVVVVDLFPAGFELVQDSIRGFQNLVSTPAGEDGEPYEGEVDGGDSSAPAAAASEIAWRPLYVDAREDRVVIFGSIGRDAKEFVYRLKATNAGRFATPPIFTESMYDRTIQGVGLGARMEVTD